MNKKRALSTVVYSGWVEIFSGLIIKHWKKRWMVITRDLNLRIQNPDRSTQFYDIPISTIFRIEESVWSGHGEYVIDVLDTHHVILTFKVSSKKEYDIWKAILSSQEHPEIVCAKEGYMTKRGGVVKNWKSRYFALASGKLYYFESEAQCKNFKKVMGMNRGAKSSPRQINAKGIVELSGAKARALKGYMGNLTHIIRIECAPGKIVSGRTYFLSAPSAKEQQEWTDAIKSGIEMYNLMVTQTDDEPNWMEIGQDINVNELNRRKTLDKKAIIASVSSINNRMAEWNNEESLEHLSTPHPAKPPIANDVTENMDDTQKFTFDEEKIASTQRTLPATKPLLKTNSSNVEIEKAVIMDTGSGFFKAGITGDSMPQTMFQSVIGREKYDRFMEFKEEEEREKIFYGKRAINSRGVLSLSYPITNGIIQNWEDLQSLMEYTLENELNLESLENHPTLLTESPFNPKKNREKALELLFETFFTPAAYIANQAVLSLYGIGRTTGLVLSCGAGSCHSTPVYEGYSISHAVNRWNFAGKNLTQYLCRLLSERHYAFSTSAEHDIARNIKEKMCYVAPNFEDEMKNIEERYFNLPDGQTITIGTESIRCPEALFDPRDYGFEDGNGVQHLVKNSIDACDIDLRKDLYSSIILSGGSTMFNGFEQRLKLELCKMTKKEPKQVTIEASDDRMFLAWRGGAVLTSIEQFQKMWITQEEYEEVGPRIVHRKCL